MGEDTAERRAQMPIGSERFLDTRTLSASHRRLPSYLRRGMDVLDVGCGTGAITRGIADAVGPTGTALGIDLSVDLIRKAAANVTGRPNLAFEIADILAYDRPAAFDVATAARVLQWLRDPRAAVSAMLTCTRPGGHVVVLDYDHTKLLLKPEPPPEFRRFYDAFLRWRAEAGMDNMLAQRLPAMLVEAGLTDVSATDEREVTPRIDPDFEVRIALWADVIATRGRQMVADGMLTEAERAGAEREFRTWIATSASCQVLHLTCAVGTRPPQ